MKLKICWRCIESLPRPTEGTEPSLLDIAELIASLGGIYYHTGNYEKALFTSVQGLQIRRAKYGRDAVNYKLAVSLLTIGNSHLELGNYSAAKAAFEQGLEMDRTDKEPRKSSAEQVVNVLDFFILPLNSALKPHIASEIKPHITFEVNPRKASEVKPQIGFVVTPRIASEVKRY